MKKYVHLKEITCFYNICSQVTYEFHISRSVREYYKLDQELFSITGNIIFTNFYAVRVFADKMNQKRDLINFPEKAIKAGQLNAMGLIDEILHYVTTLYKQEKYKPAFEEALSFLQNKIGTENLDKTLLQFVRDFPPKAVYQNKISAEDYLQQQRGDISNKAITLEELLHIHLANANPAFKQFKELFDDTDLGKITSYHQIILQLEKYFETTPTFGPENQTLFHLLRTPAVRFPNSLFDQLEFIRSGWGLILSDYLMKLYGGMDLIKEEEKLIFGGPGPTVVPDFAKSLAVEDEPERFSPDLDWMPNVVMIAKSTYVWLDQLSKKYKNDIYRLDQIPDAELDKLASRGYSALWLIGLWERSDASKKIKQIMGNPEAVSSAYSLFDYQIAHDLGGDEAYQNLRDRTWQRGIRLASDMVPNHTGIYSKWIIEHPHWFIQTDYPPYPNYSFNGPNLSHDDRIGLYIEDGYWNHSDAAVVFKRVDHQNGETRYIYHGNDGTSMPWNDTAQLNYLMEEVREAVIQTILHVARKFPIIRFDAAMTLAKKHFQRLWYPQPGGGGDIPSRAEFAMPKDQFDKIFPAEFWREVVDRVAREVPDTLLLAEAFWLMEGYFVRTLGMHRVYNSAFMNMFKNEENQKYRQSIKNVMDFNPEIMKRYVNFMNNPDEEPAVVQFGKDDKYFGTCIVMSTLPGLPMFGHGQVEGYHEKYGMEYRRSYWDEQEDQHLIERHEREIFPILKKRYIFSDVRNFVLYDFITGYGSVNENVFVYSNQHGDEKALVVYNNKFEHTAGYIKYSSATSEKENGRFRNKELAQALGINSGWNKFVVFRDSVTNLEYIRQSEEISHNGLYLDLGAFKYYVFMDFRIIEDNEFGHYAELSNYLGGRGVPNIETALKETFLQPVLNAFKEIMNRGFIDFVKKNIGAKTIDPDISNQFRDKLENLIREILSYYKQKQNYDDILRNSVRFFDTLIKSDKLFSKLPAALKKNKPNLKTILAGLITYTIGLLLETRDAGTRSIAVIDELLLSRIIRTRYDDDYNSENELVLIKAVVSNLDWFEGIMHDTENDLPALFKDQYALACLQVNRYRDVLYFNKEKFEQLLSALFFIYIIRQKAADKDVETTKISKYITTLFKKAEKSGFRVGNFVELFQIKNLKSN